MKKTIILCFIALLSMFAITPADAQYTDAGSITFTAFDATKWTKTITIDENVDSFDVYIDTQTPCNIRPKIAVLGSTSPATPVADTIGIDTAGETIQTDSLRTIVIPYFSIKKQLLAAGIRALPYMFKLGAFLDATGSGTIPRATYKFRIRKHTSN